MNAWLFWPGNLYFLNDDFIHIPLTDQNTFLQRNSVRPVHELLVKFDLLIWGKSSVGFHITAMLLHLMICYQLFRLLFIIQTKWLNINRSAARQTAFLSVALFLIYPQHAEGYAWILGRTPVLSSVFFMGVLIIFFSKKLTTSRISAAFILFLLTLFTYEQSVLLPLMLLLVTFFEKKPVLKRKERSLVSLLFVVAIIYIICRRLITKEIVGSYEGGNFISFQLSTIAENFARVIGRLWLNPTLNPKYFLVGMAISLPLVIFIFYRSMKHRSASLWLLLGCIFLMIVPIVSLGVTIRSYESGRYLYIPSIFFVMMLSLVLSNNYWSKRICFSFITLLCAYWMAGKFAASSDYRRASVYAKQANQNVIQHFQKSGKAITIDTLHVTIRRLPVFRLGFNTGIKWLDPTIDTTKIKVNYYYDEFIEEP